MTFIGGAITYEKYMDEEVKPTEEETTPEVPAVEPEEAPEEEETPAAEEAAA